MGELERELRYVSEQKGRQEGRREGELEAKIRIVKSLLVSKHTLEDALVLVCLSKEDYETYKDFDFDK